MRAWRQGVVFRDMKPENILLGVDGRSSSSPLPLPSIPHSPANSAPDKPAMMSCHPCAVASDTPKIVDFGCSCWAADLNNPDFDTTGTLQYAPPEVRTHRRQGFTVGLDGWC